MVNFKDFIAFKCILLYSKMIKELTIALFEPEIPANVGTIARTCACLNLGLVLIEPLGFVLDDRSFKRSKLDYEASIDIAPSFANFLDKYKTTRKILFSPHVSLSIDNIEFLPNDLLLFGRESTGVENYVADKCDLIVCLPMASRSRSLNLATAVSMAAYQAQKQIRHLHSESSSLLKFI